MIFDRVVQFLLNILFVEYFKEIEAQVLQCACLRWISSIFPVAVHYSAALPLTVMDRCKSSQSCSDSPISPNLICLKNAVLTLYSLTHPFLSSHFVYTSVPIFSSFLYFTFFSSFSRREYHLASCILSLFLYLFSSIEILFLLVPSSPLFPPPLRTSSPMSHLKAL